MLDNANKLIESFEHIMSMKNDVNSLFESFFTKYLVEEVSEEDYPDVAGKVSEELSCEEIKETSGPKEVITPLGIGFALAGEKGYGMRASLVEAPGSDDTIVRVKIATGKGDETIDVNLSEFDPKNATPVEMFAYCQYMDAIGEGVDNKWGSWHAMKQISQLLIRQATNRAKGIEDYQNVFGNSVESSLQAAKELLYELENPLTPMSERGGDAREYIEQEKEFYKKFIENLENM